VQGVYAEVIASNLSVGEFQGVKVDSIGSTGKIYYVKESNGKKDSIHYLGNALPKFTWSVTNSFRYKNFDLNFFIDGVYGNKIFNNTALIADKTNIKTAKNTLSYFAEDKSGISQPSMKVSDRYIEDGSYIRLSTASLGYTFDLKDNHWIKNLKIYISGSNLFLITKYKGYDPDVHSDRSSGSVLSHGIDLTTYPKARVFSAGLNVTF
jgi:iron complex outermembrane receptor protein